MVILVSNADADRNPATVQRPGFPPVPVPPLDGELLVDDATRSAAADDYGHLVERLPTAVLRPGSVDDIATMVRWASENGWTIAARGLGHSIYGRSQAEGGIVVDMTTLGDVRRVGDDYVVVDAGATWRAVVDATLPRRRTPPVLTNFLDLSVGGTLAVGGIGGTTHRHGMQTDNVRELEVVTGEGKVVTCSPDENSDLFDCVRAGLGQYALITRATLKLVAAPERARRYTLTYPDLERLAADQRLLLRRGRVDHLQGSVLADGAGWRYQLEMVLFHPSNDGANDAEVLSGLTDQRSQAQINDVSYREYLEAFDGFEQLLRSTGEWAAPHPWWLSFLPDSTAEQVARGTIQDLHADDLGAHGRVTFYPMTTGVISTPFLRVPDEEIVFPFNLVRFAPTGDAAAVERLLAQNDAFYRRARAAGGVVYPVSAFPLTPADWEEHFGSLWPELVAAKERFDPSNCLTPGYELFPRPAAHS